MSMIEAPTKTGRTIKFTPERIEQIRNLIERGTPREEIAEIIGVTVGSLQVTCSRLGISLRKPKPSNGFYLRPVTPVTVAAPPIEPPDGEGGNDHDRQSPSLTEGERASFQLVINYKGRQKVTPLDLPHEVVWRIAMEASFRGMSMADMIARMLTDAVKDMKSPLG